MGQDLRRAREHLRLSLADVASGAGVAASHVWNLENGNKDVSLEKFTAVCLALGLPASLLLCENVVVNRALLFSRAVQTRKVSATDSVESLALTLVASDYAAGCSVILCNAMATGLFSSTRWTYPTKGIADALATVIIRLEFDESLTGRWEHLRRFINDPFEAVSRLGLMTDRLIVEFSDSKTKGDYVHWMPVPGKDFDGLFHRSTNLMASFDPQAFGETIREMTEAASDAQMDAAIAHLNKGLTNVALSDNISGVKDQLPTLLKRLNDATRERGTKTALAKFMGVKLPTISRWLSGEKEPGGETTLRLLHWVEQQERQK